MIGFDRAGWPFLLGALVLALAGAGYGGRWWALPGALLAVSFLFFFRDPERPLPADQTPLAYYFGNLDFGRLAFSKGLIEVSQMDPSGRTIQRTDIPSLQTLHEQAQAGLASTAAAAAINTGRVGFMIFFLGSWAMLDYSALNAF